MNIVLNGKKYKDNTSKTLTALMKELDIDNQTVAVMINDSIISREDRTSTSLSDGDRVEIIVCAPGG